jgi:putative aldouronate transport system permease protein
MGNRRRAREGRVLDILSTLVAMLVFAATVYPLYYCLVYSLNNGADASRAPLYLLPRKPTLENYAIVFRDHTILPAFLLTVLRTVVGTALALLCLAAAAYALSKPRLVFRRFYLVFCSITLYFSAGLIPSYLLYKQLGILNTFSVYILPNLYQFFYLLICMAFFQELPASLEESARVDGAGDFTVLARIVLPLSGPVLSTVALFVGVWHWNDFITPAFFILREELMTLPAILMRVMSLTQAQQELQRVVSSYRASITMESVRYATLVVAVVPIVVVYPFAQRYFVKGMMIGAVKE